MLDEDQMYILDGVRVLWLQGSQTELVLHLGGKHSSQRKPTVLLNAKGLW